MDEEKVRNLLSTIANWKDAGTESSMGPRFYFGDDIYGRDNDGNFCCRHKWWLPCLHKVWQSASDGNKVEAQRRVVGLIDGYLSLLYKFREDPGIADYKSIEEALNRILESLGWLGRNVGKLKVCKNRECATGKSYFFRLYPRDTYCSVRCSEIERERRRLQRQLKKSKESKRSPDARENMSESAKRRWGRVRAEKDGRQSKPIR